MFGIREFLLNMLIIILEIFAYQIFWADRIKQIQTATIKKNQYILFGLSVVSIALCITFPVSFTDGFRYDLRHIPLLIATLYGGNLVGLYLTLFMLVFRKLLGGEGFVNTLIVYSIFTLLVMLVRPLYFKLNLRCKMLLSSVLIAAMCLVPLWLIRYLIIDPYLKHSSTYLALSFTVVSILTGCLSIYLVERLIESVQMRMEIQQAEKMNMLGQLTASIAHEIRNPMTASRGFMQLLKESALDDKERGYAEIAITEIDRAQEIITEYLSFAKPEMEETERINLSQHIKNVISIISGYAAYHNVGLSVNLDKAVIEGNSGKLTQCLVNLIKNAVEACTGQGTVEIAVYTEGENAVITIKDNGVGMGEEQIRRLGTPFYSTKEKGTGLGLMVCYRIIAMMEGKIRVSSQKGKGTRFTITFPAKKEES